jgi:hypothetical protein
MKAHFCILRRMQNTRSRYDFTRRRLFCHSIFCADGFVAVALVKVTENYQFSLK